MRRNLIAPAVIVGIGIIVAELMNGGFYDVRTVSGATVIWRVNKITGATYFCSGIDAQNDDIYQGCIRLSEYNLAKIADLARFVRDHPELYSSPTSTPTPKP